MLIPLVKIHGFIIGMGGLALGLSFIVYTRIEKEVGPEHKTYAKIMKYGLSLFIIFFFIYLAFPVAQDDFFLLKKGFSLQNCLVKEGEVKRVEAGLFGICWFISQDVFFYDEEETGYTLYFSWDLVQIEKSYRIYYLPYSKFIVKIEEVDKR